MSSVVVGVDGSENASAALSWAADVVGETGTLHIVEAGRVMESRTALEQRLIAPLSLAEEGLSIPTADRDPAAVIVESAAVSHADLIAVGTHSGVAHLPRAVGSVVHKILRLTPCPVAVVSAAWHPAPSWGPVVVAVGSGPASAAAVEWGSRFAAERSLVLHLVRVIDFHPFFGLDDAVDVMASYIEPEQLIRWAEEELDLVAQTIADDGIEVRKIVKSGDIGRRLVEAATDASVVVMGKHFDGPITGYITGRSLHHVLTHASCPVVVVPPGLWSGPASIR